MAITAKQYGVSKQTIRNQTIKIELLDFNFRVVDELSGNCISGNITIDANSDVRRTCQVSFVVTDSSFDIKSGSKIWLDKYIKVYVGIDELHSNETIWFNYGIYLINSPTWSYNADTNVVSFEGLDLVCKMTGERNGYLEGIPTIIPQGTSVRETMISTIKQLGGFTRYLIDECRLKNGDIQTVPYEMTFEQGSTVWDIIVALRDILPRYECFFNVDGVFVYQPIPTGKDEIVVADDDVLKDNLLDENISNDFEYVKNYIEVYGGVKTPSYYSEDVTYNSGVYNVLYPNVVDYTNNTLYGFTWNGSSIPYPATTSIKINELPTIPLLKENGEYAKLQPNKYYVALYKEPSTSHPNGHMIFLGGVQAVGIAKDENINSPFYINGTVGKIRLVCVGNEYDNIMSDELAQERAEYELWLHTNMQNSISMQTVPIHYLDVNQLISHKSKNGDIDDKYIIKNISVDLSEDGSQAIEAIKYYPLYA